MTLEGSNALVTGSSRNIGRAIAVELAKAGADVGVTAREDEAGCAETVRLVEEAGGNAATVLGDLENPDDIDRIVSWIREELGPIDVLVNNASYRPSNSFLDITLAEWDRVHNIDLRAMFLTCQAVLPDMLDAGGGRIVNVTGYTVFKGASDRSHVLANKAGIEGLTRALAHEFGPRNVRANSIALGFIDTDRSQITIENWDEYSEKLIRASALRRKGDPEEVANVCRFLVSSDSSFVTGQTIHVNGGSFPIYDISGT